MVVVVGREGGSFRAPAPLYHPGHKGEGAAFVQ